MPELRRLRYFVAVATERNFTRAAERLHVAQPALSRQVRLLERELGVELLHRTTREVTLTDAGRFLLERAPALLSATDDLWRSVRSFAAGEQGSVALGYGTSAGYETAPRLLEAIARRLPELEVSARVMATAEILDAVGEGAIDAGLVRCPPARDGLEAHVVRREPQGVLLRRDHALAAGTGGRVARAGRRRRCCCTRAPPTRATTTPCSPSAARRGVEPRGARAQPGARPRPDARRRRAGGGDRRRVLAHACCPPS